jgi:hypothetical protein
VYGVISAPASDRPVGAADLDRIVAVAEVDLPFDLLGENLVYSDGGKHGG